MVDLIKLDNWPTSKRKGKALYQSMSEIHSSNPDRMACLNAGWEAFKEDNGMKVIPRSTAANPLMATHTPPITTRPLAASHPHCHNPLTATHSHDSITTATHQSVKTCSRILKLSSPDR